MAFIKVRGAIYLVIIIKIFNRSKLLIIVYSLLEKFIFRMMHGVCIMLQTSCDVFLSEMAVALFS